MSDDNLTCNCPQTWKQAEIIEQLRAALATAIQEREAALRRAERAEGFAQPYHDEAAALRQRNEELTAALRECYRHWMMDDDPDELRLFVEYIDRLLKEQS